MSTPEPGAAPRVKSIDALVAVRAHPEWYFRSGTFDSREVLVLLTDEAVAHGSTDLTFRRLDDWWVLASSHDWLGGDLGAFYALTPDPARGRNTARVEILLTAFCRCVWTATLGRTRDVAGNALPPRLVQAVLDEPRWGRVVAFLSPGDSMSAAGNSDDPSRHLRLVTDDLSPSYDDAFQRLPGKLEQIRGGRTES